MIKVSVVGTDKLLATLQKAEKKLQDGVNREMDAAVMEINAKQIAATPVDKGILRAGNRYDITRPLNKVLYNKVEYAPYQEFGTGGLVNIPQGLEAEAEIFRGAGIREVNMAPQPFFFRPYFEEIPKLLKAVENILK
jgi:HK97 gp10 family phage protein